VRSDVSFLCLILNLYPDLSEREFQAFAVAFQSINRLLDTFRANLPPLANSDPMHLSTRTLLLTHALTDAASIKLHSIFSYADSASKQHCVTAARAMVSFGGLNLQEIGYINPIMGVSQQCHRAIAFAHGIRVPVQTLWMTACHVFIDEISRVRSLTGAWPPGAPQVGEEELMEKLRNGITALSLFSEESALMSKYDSNKRACR
jgi:hypothetical protein